jgi:PAS domain S-box-containing protein
MNGQGYASDQEKEVTTRNLMASNKNTKKSPPSPKPTKQPRKIEAKKPMQPLNRNQGLTVVGIGASADGLEVLQSFFRAVPGEQARFNKQDSQTRDLFFVLFDLNPIPTSFTRLDDGLFLDVNEAYLKYFDIERDDLIGHTSQELKLPIHPDLRPRLIKKLKKESILRNIELQVTRPNGEQRTILASMQHISLENTDMMLLALIDFTERSMAEQQIRSLASALTVAEQEERHRISQILHDDLQQRIFAVKMQTSMLHESYKQGNLESVEVDFDQLEDMLNKSIAITRNLSTELSPAVLQGEGLADALIWLSAQMHDQYGLQVSIHTNHISTRFDDTVRILLFQAVRESLFNVVKHAETNRATIVITEANGEIQIRVSDKGRGFQMDRNSNQAQATGGLVNIRHRLILMGCDLTVESQPGKETQVVIHVPAKQVNM